MYRLVGFFVVLQEFVQIYRTDDRIACDIGVPLCLLVAYQASASIYPKGQIIKPSLSHMEIKFM